MKMIIQEYGVTILALLTAGLIIGFFLGETGAPVGIVDVLAENAELKNSGSKDYEDAEVYRALSERKRPVITYMGKDVTAGLAVDWSQLFQAVDAEHNPIDVTIVAVNEQDVYDNFEFAKSGIYEIEVTASDTYGISTQEKFHIPVQRQEGKSREGEKN